MPKIQKLDDILYIVSETFDDWFDIDSELAVLSHKVFSLDEDSEKILGVLGRNGECNENAISKLCKSKPNRHAVMRKVIGIEHPERSLKNLGYLIHTRGMIHRTGTQENLLSLTLKGLVASLSKTKFDDNYIVKEFRKFLNDKFGNEINVVDLTLELIKCHIAMFLIWHRLLPANLKEQQNTTKYFLQWIEHNPIMDINYEGTATDEDLDDIFSEIRIRFFTLQSILVSVLRQSKMSKKLYYWYDSRDFTNVASVNFYEVIRYWPHYLDKIHFEDPEPYSPTILEYDYSFNAEYIIKEVTRNRNKILKRIKLRSTPLTNQNLIWNN